jgi:DNA-directed RNA polymerase specialized sigma24 family protein
MTERQTASLLGISVGAVKQHATRALSRLRADLDERCDEEAR